MKFSISPRPFRIVSIAAAFVVIAFNPSFAQSPPLDIPFVAEWAASPHARLTAEAFNHWNEQGEVPVPCARCHSTPGFRDYIGADGSKPGLDGPAPTGSVIACIACHNKVTMTMDSVTFPSGATINKVGDDSRCMTCHQGRESTVSVNKKLNGLAEDTVSPKLHFINVHYRAAGATRYGTQAKGGYEYSGKSYAGYYLHDKDYNRCADCHQQHTVRVKFAECDTCHRAAHIKKLADLKKIRKTKTDFDGDGNVDEGIAEEIDSLHKSLMKAIQSYAKQVSGTAIAYNAHQYPYFFADKNGNGKADKNESIYPNQYKAWTPRLLKAAYNYQFVAKDPGVFAHNPKYVIQLLHDSLADLGRKTKVNMAGMTRP